MSKGVYWTETGGSQRNIQATQWSQILLAREGDTAERQAALGSIAQQYWKPVYTWLARKGLDREQAKDITQGFFTDVVLGRGLVSKASPDKGRFRSFLLTAVSNYAKDFHRRQTAARRRPAEGLLSLEGMDTTADGIGGGRYDPAVDEPPDEAFHRAWASQLLDDVIADVKEQCHQLGQQLHWEVFRRRVLSPIARGGKPEAYADIADQLDLPSAARATTMNDTVKRKFEVAMREHVRPQVESSHEVDLEIRELIGILSSRQPASRPR
jgi:RNA polymerase sigma-70 factor (ECF subfamily)